MLERSYLVIIVLLLEFYGTGAQLRGNGRSRIEGKIVRNLQLHTDSHNGFLLNGLNVKKLFLFKFIDFQPSLALCQMDLPLILRRFRKEQFPNHVFNVLVK